MSTQSQNRGLLSVLLTLCCAAALISGCPRTGGTGGNGNTGGDSIDTSLSVTNASQAPVRIGIDRTSASSFIGVTSQPAGSITDLSNLLQPGESDTLPLTVIAAVEQFNVFVIEPSSSQQLLGPFPCRIDRVCLESSAARVIWTGTDVLFTDLNDAIVQLTNKSAATAYLLVGDEQPQLPLLPLSPGESRFLQVSRTAALGGTLQVRAVTFNPLVGPTVAAFTQCGLLRVCENLTVTFDGQSMTCSES